MLVGSGLIRQAFPLPIYPIRPHISISFFCRKNYFNSFLKASSKKVAMISLSFLSINKPQILASVLPSNTSSSLPPHASTKPSNPTVDTDTKEKPTPPLPNLQLPKQKRKPNKRQPSILEIERAIGAGMFRDRDMDSDSKANLTLFDKIFLKYIGTEGSVEKQLRETGEWIIDRSEKKFRSAAKPILIFVVRWILPMWVFAFLIASGIIKLPFNSPLLDDLIM